MTKLWHSDPARAYAEWQFREATGADRRRFSQRSIVQHRAMFDRFHRYVIARGTTLASFGPDVLDGFWLDGDAVRYTPATRMRYLKLIERLCRHLVAIGVRDVNPASEILCGQPWPAIDPEALFLSEEMDKRLQEFVRPDVEDNPTKLQKRAIVALFLGTGVTASEGRAVRLRDVYPEASPPYLHVPARPPKTARTVHLEPFAVAALEAWLQLRRTYTHNGALLFTLTRAGTPITDMSFGNIVREAFATVGCKAEDKGPRILRNTYCRRQLLKGVAADEVSARLGLTSNRTVARIAATIAIQKGR